MSRNRLFLSFILCYILLAFTFALLSGQDGALAQTFPTSTPVFPTIQAPTLTPTACLPSLNFKPGDIIALTPGVIIRTAPTASSALIVTFPERRQFTIVDGPVCQGGFNWWNITGHGVTGWAAEGRQTLYWMRFVSESPDAQPKCLTPMSLVVGERISIVTGVRIRVDPSLAALTRTVVPLGATVTVLGGPQCADGYNWWKVRATVVGVVYEGWMAEASRYGDNYVQVTPSVPCTYPRPFRVGDRVAVTYNDGIPKRLRAQPSLNAPILYDLLKEVPMDIIGGPVCVDSYNWWQVRVLASQEIVGWIAEGGPAQFWLVRVYGVPTETPTFTPMRTPTS
jgi:hypothetical protein